MGVVIMIDPYVMVANTHHIKVIHGVATVTDVNGMVEIHLINLMIYLGMILSFARPLKEWMIYLMNYFRTIMVMVITTQEKKKWLISKDKEFSAISWIILVSRFRA